MNPIIDDNLEALKQLCLRYCVARLELFGSAAGDDFDPASSDLDFLVDFQPDSPMGPFHQYFDFLEDLKRLFGRPVDLVEASAMKNPYFIRNIQSSRRLLYAA